VTLSEKLCRQLYFCTVLNSNAFTSFVKKKITYISQKGVCRTENLSGLSETEGIGQEMCMRKGIRVKRERESH